MPKVRVKAHLMKVRGSRRKVRVKGHLMEVHRHRKHRR